MSVSSATIYTCDRCGIKEPARDLRNAEDDDGFPHNWSVVNIRGVQLADKELCKTCTDDLCSFIRGASNVVPAR